jgi:hypothetical protein
MSLPAPGNPISANMINVEANRTGSTYAPLSVNQIPVSTSLIGLYVDSGVNQAAPHKYSEFFSKTLYNHTVLIGLLIQLILIDF